MPDTTISEQISNFQSLSETDRAACLSFATHWPEKTLTFVLQSASPADEIILKALSSRGTLLARIDPEKQTEQQCLVAVGKDGLALQYVRNQTFEVCRAAIRNNPDAIGCIRRDTFEREPELASCIYGALKISPQSLKFLRLQNEAFCRLAVEQEPATLQFVQPEFQTESICEIAITADPELLANVQNKTRQIVDLAVTANPLTLRYVPAELQDQNLCERAVLLNPLALELVQDEPLKALLRDQVIEMCHGTPELFKLIAEDRNYFGALYGMEPAFLNTPVMRHALRLHPNETMDDIWNNNDRIFEADLIEVLERDGKLLRYADHLDLSLQVCRTAVQQDIRALQYVPEAYMRECFGHVYSAYRTVPR